MGGYDAVNANAPRPYASGKIAAKQELLKLEMDMRVLYLGFVYEDKDLHIEEFIPLDIS